MEQPRSVFAQHKEEVWRQLCRQVDGVFIRQDDIKEGEVVAKVGEWTVTLDTFRVMSRYDYAIYTRMRAPFVNPEGFRFSIYHRDLFSDLGKLLGMQDIEVGDPAFDEKYIIKGNDAERVKQLFSLATIRERIDRQPTIYLEVKDDEGWFKESFPEGVDELYVLVDGQVTDLDRLKGLFDLFADVLNAMTHTGSAYGNDTNLAI